MSHIAERVLVGSLQKFSVEDGPGIRTTIFFKGCPLDCKWCHNPELIDERQQLIKSQNNCIGCGHCVKACPQDAISISAEEGVIIDRTKCDLCLVCANECYAKTLRPVARFMTVDEILEIAAQDKGFYDKTGGGITVSGGEILMHASFVGRLGDGKALMELAKKKNVTNILYDMKSIDDEIHRAYTGVSNRRILDNLRQLSADPEIVDKLIMRMPLIKGVNDSEDIIVRTGAFFRELGIKKVNLLQYHNLGISKKRNIGGVQEEFLPPTEERMNEIEVYFKNEINLKVEILGRV